MIAWLTDTLIYTGLLIALVLALRGPVARAFGPQMAYALWALPLLRFVMPPIVLPSSFAPEPAAEWSGAYPDALAETSPDAMLASFPTGETVVLPPEPVAAAAEPAALLFDPAMLVDVALAVWIAGVVLFLTWRSWTYLKMREELLEGSRPVGEAGKVRLVETPAVNAPVAFGVSDKVVALPMEFMAWEDRQARDLAIEHELAHHRGGDLLANMLAQPLLALHWFNPLAWIGWRAMRRDQEAACDARVIAYREPHERAFYGEVIASFAAGPRLALAAPMACPMLGEKSIIHRLRSLNMSDVSPRRRLVGRSLLAGAALALPFTASISYAEAHVPPPPPAPPVPMVAPVAPDAPEAPDAPVAPEAPYFRWHKDGDVDVQVQEEDGKRVVTITSKAPRDHEARRPKVARSVVAAPKPPKVKDRYFHGRKMSEEEWEAYSAEMEKFGAEMEKLGREWEQQSEEYARQWEEWGEQFAEKWEKDAENNQAFAVAVNFEPVRVAARDCRDGVAAPVKATVSSSRSDDGALLNGVLLSEGVMKQVVICDRIARNSARGALIEARRRVERVRDLSDKDREKVLKSLDREIERLSTDS